MTDREMLKMAAKAAGKKFQGWREDKPGSCCMYVGDGESGAYEQWSPRDDDGDSRRLQVKLRIQVEFCRTLAGRDFLEVHAYPSGRGDCAGVARLGGDDDAATRMAVLQAAAKLGGR